MLQLEIKLLNILRLSLFLVISPLKTLLGQIWCSTVLIYKVNQNSLDLEETLNTKCLVTVLITLVIYIRSTSQKISAKRYDSSTCVLFPDIKSVKILRKNTENASSSLCLIIWLLAITRYLKSTVNGVSQM